MRYRSRSVGIGLVLAVIGGAVATPTVRGQDSRGPQGRIFEVNNESGLARTINVGGFPVVATGNAFFRDLGVNGRRCVTCHEPATNMTVTPESLRARFEITRGTDPIFRTNDGSNSPLANTSTFRARRDAYSMLLTKGVIRVGMSVPATANVEFELLTVEDPYGYAGHNTNGNDVPVPPAAAGHQPQLPQRRHVGRSRNPAEGVIVGDSLRPSRPVELRDPGPCAAPLAHRRGDTRPDRRL
jgi:hypothetical protein